MLSLSQYPAFRAQTLSGCFDVRKTAKNWIVSYGWGGRIRTSEWRDQNMGQDNQQVAETTDRQIPSAPLNSPSLPPNLPPALGETAVVLGPVRATTNYLLLSANLRAPHLVASRHFGRRRISASPGTIRRSRENSHFVSSVEPRDNTAAGAWLCPLGHDVSIEQSARS